MPRNLPPLIPRETLFGNPDKTNPQISPDGKYLAYLAPVNGVLNVWVKMVGQNDEHPVSKETNRGIRTYMWAYDNKHILYLQDNGGDENWAGWSGESHSPRGPEDPPQWNLMHDWNALQPGWHIGRPPFDAWWAVIVGHVPKGGGVNAAYHFTGGGTQDPDGSDGGNQMFNDGSARWAPFSELTPVFQLPTHRQYWLYQ